MSALPAFASIADLSGRLGGLNSSEDQTRAQGALDDASALIRLEAGIDWTDPNDPTSLDPALPASVTVVCLAAARRVMENPDGLSQEQLGHYQASYFEGSNDCYLTKADRRIIRRAAGQSSFSSIAQQSPFISRLGATVWVPVGDGTGDDLPYLMDLGPDTVYDSGEVIL